MSARPRVLVIDDDPLFRSLITSILRRDYLVTVAADGAEGYYKALEYPPQLAVIDIQMPGWDGLRTLEAMRAHQSLAKIPIMMLTSDASRQTVLSAIQAGARDYLIKTNLNRDELLNKAKRLMKLNHDTAAAVEIHPPAAAPARAPEVDAAAVPVSATPQDLDANSVQAMVDNWE